MKLVEILTDLQISEVEKFANHLWHKLGINIKFTRHFLQRVNDERNGKDITTSELIRLFKKEYERYGHDIANLPDNHEAVLKDLTTKINLPFVLRHQPLSKEIITKSVMRKNNFSSNSPQFSIK